jgi:GNAT superfamily N-acetyltransferase
MLTIRDATPDDYARVGEILSLNSVEPITADDIRSWDKNNPTGLIRRRAVGLDPAGRIVAYSIALLPARDIPYKRWFLSVNVDPDHRRQGAGTQMYEDALAFAKAHGAQSLTSEVSDSDPAGLRFMEKLGFRVRKHTFSSRLDVATFDETPFKNWIEQVVMTGIRFSTLAAEGNTREAQWKLYTLNRAAALDNPSSDGEDPLPDFEVFYHQVLNADWFRPDGQILAIDGEQYVGLGAVSLSENSAYAAFTGVDRAYRGRGIAHALKLLTIRYAREHGAAALYTDNDSANAPMLAINRKFGFVPEAGMYLLMKETI